MVAKGISQPGGSLIAYVVSRLRPGVFSHPIWVHFGDRNQLASPETIEEFLTAAKQLQKDDPASACQILLVCAVHQNYSGQRAAALQTIQQILDLTERYALDNEFAWASWGASAICFQEGDFVRAVGYLRRLQSRLREQGEWVLANFIETVEQSLPQQVTTARVVKSVSSSDLLQDNLMRQTFDWLGQWGFSTRLATPEFQASSAENDQSLLTGSDPAPLVLPGPGWRGYLDRLKRIVRGEFKLKWVANGAIHRTWEERQQTGPPPANRLDRTKPFPNIESQAPLPNSPETNIPAPSKPEKSTPEASLLIYCLGPFRVYKNDLLIEKWPGNKCRQILKYLVVHREAASNQEVLMELFWPEMEAKAARRNLYQAIYNLRQALQGNEASLSYVLTEENHYRLNPDLDLWVDSEAFDQHYQKAQTLIAAKRQEEAMREFQQAESLYQGEFLAEDRYEDWPLVYRENMKNAYLGALDQLSQHFYNSEAILHEHLLLS